MLLRERLPLIVPHLACRDTRMDQGAAFPAYLVIQLPTMNRRVT